MKRYLLAAVILGFLYSCSDNAPSSSGSSSAAAPAAASSSSNYDSLKGAGKFTHVDVGTTIDGKLVAAGKSIYDLKCSACHKLTSEKLVGPGWLGVTERRKPEWIMNFVTNTDEMIDKDPHAQAMLQVCMVRMPNQHLSDDDARNVLEFMRNNDKK
jgi:mono/diheme cytochrome c family protein